MLDVLSHLFAAICGQNPSHTWAPGEVLLPCCQRCTGVYCGAAMAALLHLWLRPSLSSRFLEIHGAFLLAMVPLGFHWVSQGPVLRTMSGVLFAFGVVSFLWLPLRARAGAQPVAPNSPLAQRQYFLILSLTLILLPLGARFGGAAAACALSILAALGAVTLGALATAVIGLGLTGTLRHLIRLATSHAEA